MNENQDGSLRRITTVIIPVPVNNPLRTLFLKDGDLRLGEQNNIPLQPTALNVPALITISDRLLYRGAKQIAKAKPENIVVERVELRTQLKVNCRMYSQVAYVRVSERVSGFRYTIRFSDDNGYRL